MTPYALIILVVVFLLTSAVGVVTGSNSLIAVPVMFQFGIEPRVAVATNMFGLLFMSIGATIPFVRQGKIDVKRVSPMIVLTVIASTIGAILVGVISNAGIKLIVSIAMISVAVFSLLHRNKGVEPPAKPMAYAMPLTLVLTFLMGIYGGVFSGGYVTILTAIYVAVMGMSYTEAVASTKLINVFSSGVATAVFMWQGLIDYKLGIILGITMFVGAYIGAHYATKLNDIWLRRIFLTTVILLAIKTLYDFL